MVELVTAGGFGEGLNSQYQSFPLLPHPRFLRALSRGFFLAVEGGGVGALVCRRKLPGSPSLVVSHLHGVSLFVILFVFPLCHLCAALVPSLLYPLFAIDGQETHYVASSSLSLLFTPCGYPGLCHFMAQVTSLQKPHVLW